MCYYLSNIIFIFSILLVILVSVLGIHYADAEECIFPRCSAQINHPADDIKGAKYSLHVPDMFIKSDDCLTNLAVATQWLKMNNNEWIELGVTQGSFDDRNGDGIGNSCITTEQVYYGIKSYDMFLNTNVYREYTFSRNINVGDILTFEIKRGAHDRNWLLY